MSDNPSPADKDKIADILAIIVAKGDEQKAALIELADQTRQTKTVLSDVLAQRSEYAADIRDLKAAIDTTRRALDPKALAEHVADNNNAFMGEITEKFARALNANANAERDHELRNTNRAFEALANKLHSETALLAGLASRFEARDERSKWDWVTLAAAMAVAALLAGHWRKPLLCCDPMTKRTIEQQIAQANDRLNRLKARQKKAEARRHIVLGAALLSVGRMDAENAKTVMSLLDQAKLREAEARDLGPVLDELRQVAGGSNGGGDMGS